MHKGTRCNWFRRCTRVQDVTAYSKFFGYFHLFFQHTFTKMKRVIGIHGRGGSGKDTVAQMIDEIIPHTTEFIATARPIKDALGILLGLTREQMYDPIEKEVVIDRFGKSARQLMQEFGTACKELYGQDIFANILKWRIQDSCEDVQLITDVRFLSEVNVIRQFPSSIIIKIVRPEEFLTNHSNHESEIPLDDSVVDYVVYNDGTLAELKQKIAVILSSV